jgi:hypothetical protein
MLTRGDIARNEGKVCPVVFIEYFLRTGGTYGSHEKCSSR